MLVGIIEGLKSLWVEPTVVNPFRRVPHFVSAKHHSVKSIITEILHDVLKELIITLECILNGDINNNNNKLTYQ